MSFEEEAKYAVETFETVHMLTLESGVEMTVKTQVDE